MVVFEVTFKSISSMILSKLKCISPFSNEEFDLTFNGTCANYSECGELNSRPALVQVRYRHRNGGYLRLCESSLSELQAV